MYLPDAMIPDTLETGIDFEEFLRLCALAELARELRLEDIEVGVNRGYVDAYATD